MTYAPLLAALLASIPASAHRPDDEAQVARLLSFDEVEARLGEPNFRLLDVRPRDDYEAGHIPGALWVDAREAQRLAGEPGGLEDPGRWTDWMAGLGLGPDTAVSVYDASRQKDAARFWWLLGYLGVDEVGLIDGGFPLWEAEGRPVSTKPATVEPRAFPVRLRADRYASRSDVLDAIEGGKARVVDSRSYAEYLGDEVRSKRGGRIPTACHLEWATLVDEEGRFLPEESVRPLLEAIGLEPGKPVITHCQSGGRASVDAFVLQRLGFPSRNYYLGWSDWGNDEGTPIEAESEVPARR